MQKTCLNYGGTVAGGVVIVFNIDDVNAINICKVNFVSTNTINRPYASFSLRCITSINIICENLNTRFFIKLRVNNNIL